MTRYLILLGAAGLLLAVGCRKDDVVSCAQQATSVESLADFTSRNSAPYQTFALALGASQTITLTGGSTLAFPASGFVLPTSTSATGTAQVRVRAISTVPEMVLANMPSNMVNGSTLISGGEFNIQVWQNATRLRLQYPAQVSLQTPIPANQDSTRQRLWFQRVGALPPDSAGWQQAASSTVQQLPGLYRAALPLDSIGWWNIDQAWRANYTPTLTKVTILTSATAAGETRVYLRPIDFNGLGRTYPSNPTRTHWLSTMPVGSEVLAIVLQFINGQLYYGTQRITVSSSLIITPVVTAVSEAEAVRLIRQL